MVIYVNGRALTEAITARTSGPWRAIVCVCAPPMEEVEGRVFLVILWRSRTKAPHSAQNRPASLLFLLQLWSNNTEGGGRGKYQGSGHRRSAATLCMANREEPDLVSERNKKVIIVTVPARKFYHGSCLHRRYSVLGEDQNAEQATRQKAQLKWSRVRLQIWLLRKSIEILIAKRQFSP